MSKELDLDYEKHGSTGAAIKLVIDALKGNAVGGIPNVDKPTDVISFVFSNLSRYFAVGIRESVIKFAKENSDLSMVNRLKDGFQEAIRLAVDKKQISEMLDTLDEHLKISKNKEIFTRVRETLVKSLEKTNEELNKVSRQFKYFDLDPIRDSPEKILDKVVRTRYGRFLFNRLDKIFRASVFFRAIILFMEDDPEWRLAANTALTWGIQSKFIKGEQPGFLKRIFKDIGGLRFLSTRKLLGLAARGVVAGIVTDLTVQAAYKFGKDYLFSKKFKDWFGEELYEMKWYVNLADTILPFLFNDLSKDELGNVTKIAHLISMGFRDEENKVLPSEDIGTLFGNEDYKDMDYKKTIRIFGEIYELVTGTRIPQDTIDDEASLSQFLDMVEVHKIFALKEGRKLIPSLGDDGSSQFLVSYAGENDDLGIAARYTLKHKLDFVLVDKDVYTQERLKDEYQDLMLFDPNNQDTYSGMTDEYLHRSAEMLGKTVTSNNENFFVHYKDLASGKEKNVPRSLDLDPDYKIDMAKKIIFGTNDADERSALQGDIMSGDHIFGGGGNDVLDGKQGDDYMEGGKDFDTYIINGHDTVLDTDNKGEIFFNEKTEANHVHYFVYDKDKKEWHSSDESGNKDGKYIAHREPSSNSLKITKAGGKDSVEIKDYFRNGNDKLDGSLGLETVPEKVEEEPLPPSPEVKEFIITPPAKRGHNDFYLGFDSYQVNGTKYNDTIYGRTARQGKGGVGIYAPMGGGNDLAYGSWYDDVIDGGDDTDIIYGSEPGGYITQKRSRADKDKDGDTIVGGAGSDFLFGMAGKDFIFGGSRTEHEETKPVAGQGDWANGGDGNDHIFGSAAQDVLQGGKGQDEIKGGAGDDLIIGDSDVMPNVKIMRGGASDGLPTFLHKYNFKTHQMDKPEIYYTVNQLAKATAEWKIEIAANNRDYKIIRSTERLPELAGERSTIDDLPANSDASALPGSDNDTLEGGPGNDFILGQHGSDFINGGSGNDIIYGDDRSSLGSEEVYYNDHLIGGSGSDYLNGGRGADNYYFIREDFQPEKDGDAVPTDTIDDDGTGNIGVSGGRHDAIYLDRVDIAAMQWVRDGNNNIWNTADGWRISYSGSTLQISHKEEVGKINVLNFVDGDYGLHLPENPQPPQANNPPQVGKTIPSQTVKEKSQLQFTLPADAFNDPDNDALKYTATLADGKALPKWLHFDAAKRTFSGTPSNDDVGNLSIRVTANDGKGGRAAQDFSLEVVNVNDAPQVGTALANQEKKGGKPWQYRLPADAFYDIDKDDTLTLSATLENGQPLPAWLKFDAKTGQFTGTPPDSGHTYRIVVIATDRAGAQVEQSFNLTVSTGANQSPVINTTIPAQKTNEKDEWRFTLPEDAFSDPDGDPLTYTATLADGKALPKWLHFDAAKRTFSGTPGNDDVGNLSIRVTATDGRGGSATQNFTLEVVNVNDAPQIGATLANQQGTGGKPWQYRLPANAFRDIDKGDVLTISAKLDNGQPLPSWLKFDGKTGQFSGTLPSSEQASAYRIAVTATDKAGAQAKQVFNLSIAAAPLNRIQGTAGSDNLQGSNGADYISGNAGNDRLDGKDGNDIIDGGLGNDSLIGGKGDDIYRFSGQFGNDGIHNFDIANYDYRTDRCDIIEFTDRKRSDVTIMRIGNNLSLRTQDGQSVAVYDNFSNKGKNSHYINFIRFSDMTLSADDIKAILQNGTSDDDHLYAKPEGSVLYAGAGNDTIIGNIGNDNLFGEDGNDTLRGNAGDDYLHGEDGDDALYGDAGKDYLDGGNGNDKLYGGADNDRLFGDRGNDVLFGGDGDDTLDGSDGDDLLYGEAGNDELFGSSGNDVLNGGTGNDKLSGYEGNDIYQFNGNFGQDIIQNKNNQNMLFGSQYDRIDFTDLQQQDLIFRRSGNNLLLVSKKHANNQVTVLDHFRDNGKTAARIDEIRFADGSRLDYDAINRLVQSNNNPSRANLVHDRYAADAARQAQVMTQAMAASGSGQPLDNLMAPYNPPLMPPLFSNFNP